MAMLKILANFVTMIFGKQKNANFLMLGMPILVILSRLLPHAPNFTGTLAAIIFSAVMLKSWRAFGGILVAYLLSDLLINNVFYRQNEILWLSSGIFWILLPFFVIFMTNIYLFKKEFSPFGILGTSLLSSTIFFLISNFGVWISSQITYTHDLNGLLLCYFNALPFFAYEIAGSLFYSSVLFSVYWIYFYEYRNYEYPR